MSLVSGLRKLIVWGCFASILALVWVSIVEPLRSRGEQNLTALNNAKNEAARLQQSIQTLKAEKKVLQSEGPLENVWIAENSGEAVAQVQAVLSELATNLGVSLRSVTPLENKNIPMVEAVAFRIEAEATLDVMTNFVVTIEFNKALLIIERASIRRLARATQNSEQPTVFFQLDITAPVRISGDKS